MSEDICYADATELARRIRARELSPVEVLDAHLKRIEDVNPKINSIVTLVEDAVERARAAESAVTRGEALGPLHGVPFTIKDCVDTAGVRTTRGSRLFQDYVPTADAPPVTRLKEAGGVFMAKTNMPEFALWWETDNLVFGRTVNPWNPERTAGGSSGGEASAIASGLSPLGIGSDVGGSIRAPAHHCGIVGLKPTHGRVPLTGHWPEVLLRAMHVGPMARTVRDIALELSIISGPDGADPYAMPVPVPGPLVQDSPLSGLRIGWSSGDDVGPVDPEVGAVVARAAAALAEAGCHVQEVAMPGLADRNVEALTLAVFGAEGRLYLEPIVAGREDELSPNIQRRMAAPPTTLADYLAALEDWEGLRQDVAGYFRQYDLLICPCVPVPAHPHDVAEITIAGTKQRARTALRDTIPWDITGSPAISVPFGFSSEGLPIGVQIVGRHFDEHTVIRAAAALEEMSDTTTKRPPL